MIRLSTATTFVSAVLMMAAPFQASAADKVDIIGEYDSQFIGADGKTRKGPRVVIAKDRFVKDAVQITWDMRPPVKGIGVVLDQTLAVSSVWEFFGPHPYVESYKIGEDKLEGKAAGGVEKEVIRIVLTKKKR